MENIQDFKKLRADRLNNILDCFSGSPSILYTHNTLDSAELPRIYPSNVSNWRKGGYINKKSNKIKEYITEAAAQNIITVLNKRMENAEADTRFRIEYLLGYDNYMTEEELEDSRRKAEKTKESLRSDLLDSVSFLLNSQKYRVHIKNNAYRITKDNKELVLSESEFIKFANHIADYTAFLMSEHFSEYHG